MITQQTKELVIKALEDKIDGDNLYRFQLQFKNYSPERMNTIELFWGQPMTPQSVIDRILEANKKYEDAIKEIKNMLVF